MVNEYFMNEISYNKEDECNDDVFAAKKKDDYMFLISSKFKFSNVKNYIGPSLSYAAWYKSIDCELTKKVNVPMRMVG